MTFQRSWLFVIVLLLAAGCAGPSPKSDEPTGAEARQQDSTSETSVDQTSSPARNPTLNAVLWTQHSAEYWALARQTYRTGRRQLDRALADDSWSAALEQDGDYAAKPPAVILDVDETVLDNSAYQVRLIREGRTFDSESWNAWCREATADAVPGALEFTQYAAENGVTVFYVTNRQHVVEEATRENLESLGFPVADGVDVVLTKGEKESWGSDKTPRREFVAQNYRILLQFGDNLGDFFGESEGPSSQRLEKTKRHAERFGTSWFVLPNPMYGDWEAAPYDFDYGKSPEHKGADKIDALDAKSDAEKSRTKEE